MAGNRKTIDTDLIYIRDVYARTAFNQTIPVNQVLIANGDDSTRWDYLRVSTFNTIIGDDKVPLYANNNLSTINISTTGPPGLLTSYVDPVARALMLRVAPPVIGISQRPVPGVNTTIAAAPPDLVSIQNYSSINLLGVKDILLSTVTGVAGAPPSVFVSISSFTSAGYSTISGETFAWRPYVYEVLSTAQGLPTFTSSIETTWPTGLQNLSTAEAYPNYTTGDVYFSSLSINMSNYIGYIESGVTKVFLEVEPTYLLPRFLLGTEEYPNLFKNISSYIQYTNDTGAMILLESLNSDVIVSQQSNAYTSNFFNKHMKMPIDSATIVSNWELDGATGYYTLFHRIPGGMAQLVSGDACGYNIGQRGGMSNEMPTYINATPIQNGNFMSIYNTMPFPLTPEQLAEFLLTSSAPGGFSIGTITGTEITISWQGAIGAISYIFIINGITIIPTPGQTFSLSMFSEAPQTITATVTGKTATFRGLSVGTTYSITVVAVAAGGAQTYSSSLFLMTSPAPPENLSVSGLTSSGFVLSWLNAVGATSYSYTLNGLLAAPFSETNSSATFTGLTPNTSYLIGISSVNSGGSTPSTQGLQVRTAPGAPNNFSSTVGTTSIAISWLGAEGATSYSFLVNNAPVSPSSQAGLSATFTGLLSNTQYNFVVTAIGNGGSTSSAPYSVTTGGPPINLSANTIRNTSFNLTWIGSFDNATYTYTMNGNAPSFYDISVNTVGKLATFTQAAPNTTYSIIVIANRQGVIASSTAYPVTTLPNPPTAPVVSANSITTTGFSLSWTGGSGATSFTYAINGSTVVPSSSGANTATFTGLVSSTTYSNIIVTATNTGGSTPSAPISVTTLTPAPTAPVLSSSAITSTSFTVNWQSNTNATSFTYSLGGAPATPSSTSPTSATFTGLSFNTAYVVRVTATNSTSSAESSPLTVTTLRTAPAPFTISSSSITTTGFVISREADDSNVTSYTYTLNGTTTTPFSTTSTSATFTGLAVNTTYNVIAIASNNGGSVNSNTISVTTLRTAPTAPVITASAITSSSFTFSWSADVASYTYRIGSGSEIPVTGTSVNLTGLSANTLYQVVLTATNDGGSTPSNTLSTTTLRTAPTAPVITSSAITSSSFTVNWSADANVTSYTYRIGSGSEIPVTGTSVNLTGLSANTPYQVVLTAINNGGSAASNTLSVTTLRTAPTAPVITSSAITSTSFVISWSLDTNVTSYTYTLDGGAATPASTTSTSATFTGRAANTSYNVIVTATNNGGSTASNTLAVRTIIDPPTDLSANTITSSGFTLTWTGSAGANNYTFLLGGNVATPTYTPGATTATFTGLSNNTLYSVQVIATDGTRNSVASTALAVTTFLPPITFSSSGTALPSGYIVPTEYTQIYVELLAGCGAGYGTETAGWPGGGGGGGAYIYGSKIITPGNTLSITLTPYYPAYNGVVSGGGYGNRGSPNATDITLSINNVSVTAGGGYDSIYGSDYSGRIAPGGRGGAITGTLTFSNMIPGQVGGTGDKDLNSGGVGGASGKGTTRGGNGNLVLFNTGGGDIVNGDPGYYLITLSG